MKERMQGTEQDLLESENGHVAKIMTEQEVSFNASPSKVTPQMEIKSIYIRAFKSLYEAVPVSSCFATPLASPSPLP